MLYFAHRVLNRGRLQVPPVCGLATERLVPLVCCTFSVGVSATTQRAGVQISHGVSRHGLALNVCPDMSYFDCIVPCGQVDRGVTSVQQVLAGTHCSVEEVHALLAQHLSRQLGCSLV